MCCGHLLNCLAPPNSLREEWAFPLSSPLFRSCFRESGKVAHSSVRARVGGSRRKVGHLPPETGLFAPPKLGVRAAERVVGPSPLWAKSREVGTHETQGCGTEIDVAKKCSSLAYRSRPWHGTRAPRGALAPLPSHPEEGPSYFCVRRVVSHARRVLAAHSPSQGGRLNHENQSLVSVSCTRPEGCAVSLHPLIGAAPSTASGPKSRCVIAAFAFPKRALNCLL